MFTGINVHWKVLWTVDWNGVDLIGPWTKGTVDWNRLWTGLCIGVGWSESWTGVNWSGPWTRAHSGPKLTVNWSRLSIAEDQRRPFIWVDCQAEWSVNKIYFTVDQIGLCIAGTMQWTMDWNEPLTTADCCVSWTVHLNMSVPAQRVCLQGSQGVKNCLLGDLYV